MSLSSQNLKMTPTQKNNLYEIVSGYLKEHDLDGFFMPKTDAHRSEYCRDEDNLMLFFTQFSGSTGACAFMSDSQQGAVFVDGRYTLQAHDEVDQSRFDVVDYTPEQIAKWIQKNTKSEAETSQNTKHHRIGFDPFLLSLSEFTKYQNQFRACNLDLVAMETNPIVDHWHTRPAQTIFALSAHDEQYAGVSYSQKLSLIRDQMHKDKASTFFLNFPESICWLLNIRAKDCDFTPVAPLYALVHDKKPTTIFCHEAQKDDLHKIFGDKISVESYESTFTDVNRFNNESVAVDPNCATVKMKTYIEAAGGKVLLTRDYCDIPRACKNPVEIKGATEAHVKDGVAVCHLLSWLETQIQAQKQISELDVVKQLEAFRQDQPLYQGKSFDTISGSGPNGAIVHYRVSSKSNRILLPNDIFLLDSGGQYLEGTTDVTRTISLSKKPTPEQKAHSKNNKRREPNKQNPKIGRCPPRGHLRHRQADHSDEVFPSLARGAPRHPLEKSKRYE